MFAMKREAGGGGDGEFPSSSSYSSSLPPPPPQPPISHPYDPTAAVGDLVSSLNKRRMYREVTLALRSGLRDATAEFSFLRIRGLRVLLKALLSIADNDAAIALFHHSQSVPELQVVPVLFQNTLNHQNEDPVLDMSRLFGVDPIKITSPATDSEVALGLKVLEGCCLLHKESKHLAHQHCAIKVLVNLLTTRGTLEQGSCLDALVSLMLDSPSNQLEFEACHGVEKIAELIKDENGDLTIRLKCGEFLLLLIGHLNGREWPPLATIHDDIRNLLGEKCASFIWAASQFGSTLDPEQRQTALQIQARRVLEALEFV